MIRNIKHYLASEEGLAMLDVISTVVLFALFIAIVIYVWKMPKEKIDTLKNIPFNDKND
ncbi:MAG: cbb3-type cytochrome c oxidase subunit 3 [Chlorobi bacterium]|nr:cbb3-type cytochrome c oxidase subunit 3 [Chlorobiota bacterium]